jgi:protein-S-isoprenylcysteine O-methyltransferase Ste14
MCFIFSYALSRSHRLQFVLLALVAAVAVSFPITFEERSAREETNHHSYRSRVCDAWL